MWDTRRAALMQTIDLHTDVVYSLSLNRDGSRMVTTCRDKRLRIIDPLSGKLLQVWSCVVLFGVVFSKKSRCFVSMSELVLCSFHWALLGVAHFHCVYAHGDHKKVI